ncbi:sensor histidine kinase [Terrihabitans sp. B22-R8]|uniref:sensor histidine kinase n=1 Tax=Terrihabitans sp. B22-R8 TaxID=3425128 RepID=UPI00403C4DB5
MRDGETRPGEIRHGLSGKLLKLTVLFVMLAVVLVYVPWVATFYERWLADRLGRAHSVALVLDAAPQGMVPEALARRLLQSVGARLIVLQTGETRSLLASSDMPPAITRKIDLREPLGVQAYGDAFGILFGDGKGVMRVLGEAPTGGQLLEVVIDEAPLRRSMLALSRTVVLSSLLVSAITGVLIYLSLDRLIVRPMRRLADRMTAFRNDPADGSAVIVPSRRKDEIGLAERELASMQIELHGQLQSRARLAALGLAVAKINHDLRNLLAAAQLASERLAGSSDPAVRRLSGKLVSTLERAVEYCRSTLAYGAVRERAPERRFVDLHNVVTDVREALGLSEEGPVGWSEAIEGDLRIDADPDQLFRVLLNLARNSVQALGKRGPPDPARDQIRIAGRREGAIAIIEVSDTGPGIPEKAREHLFAAFQGSTTPGGTGLGLAIAAELVRAHGGDIRLIEGTLGATFRITIPDRPIELRQRAEKRVSA